MATDYVVDACAVARLFLDQPGADEFTRWYQRRRRERCRFLAPDLLPYELANILHRERGNSKSTRDPDYMLDIVRDTTQGIEIDPDSWARTWKWAGRLTAYDASYVALAEAKTATLVTYDKRLAQVASETVRVIGPDGLD